MGSTSRLFLILAVLFVGTTVAGQKLARHIPLDQIPWKISSRVPPSGDITPGSEESVVPLERFAGVWVARVELNDLYQARLIVDTGATFTTISEDLAFDAGVNTDPQYPHINLYTAGGNVKAEMGIAKNIRVGNAGRDDVRVVIHTIPNLPEGIDGLLGLSFFDKFMVHLDQSTRQLHLSPKS